MEKHFPLTPNPQRTLGKSCPHLNFNMWKSDTELRGQLSPSPEVKQSNRPVLHTDDRKSSKCDAAVTQTDILCRDIEGMIPGYTGFVPKSLNYFGCGYSETCRKAFSAFYKGRGRQPTDQPPVPKRFLYQPAESFTPLPRPYVMDDSDPHKHFISGYTGHVPHSRYLIGRGYPIITNQALIQCGKRHNREMTPPVTDPTDKVMIPMFTGHVPGMRDMYGKSFGQIARDVVAKRISEAKP